MSSFIWLLALGGVAWWLYGNYGGALTAGHPAASPHAPPTPHAPPQLPPPGQPGHAVHSLGGLLTDDCQTVEVDTYALPPGEASVWETAGWMTELIARGAVHPVVRLHAERAVAGVGPTDYDGQIGAIERYLRARFQYVRDPEPSEYLQTPWWQLSCGVEQGRPIAGDCDDAVLLSLSMLAAVGFPWRLELVSQPPAEPGELNHVRGAVELPSGEWIPVDLTTRGGRRMPEYRVEVVEAA